MIQHTKASQDARVMHYAANLACLDRDVADSGAALAELRKETEAFTAEQRTAMSDAISAHMRSITPVKQPSSSSSSNKTQANNFIFNYLTEAA